MFSTLMLFHESSSSVSDQQIQQVTDQCRWVYNHMREITPFSFFCFEYKDKDKIESPKTQWFFAKRGASLHHGYTEVHPSHSYFLTMSFSRCFYSLTSSDLKQSLNPIKISIPKKKKNCLRREH